MPNVNASLLLPLQRPQVQFPRGILWFQQTQLAVFVSGKLMRDGVYEGCNWGSNVHHRLSHPPGEALAFETKSHVYRTTVALTITRTEVNR